MECYSCESLAGRKPIKPGPVIFTGTYWIVDHAYPSKLVGWLVIVFRRHATSLHELSGEEFNELKDLIQKSTTFLHEELGTNKEYIAFFAEKEGFEHVHVHVIPRSKDLPAELRGPKIFSMLKPQNKNEVPDDKIKQFTLRLRNKFFH